MKISLFAIMMQILLIEDGITIHQKSPWILTARTSRFDKEPQDSNIHIPQSIEDHGIEDYEKVELEKTFPYKHSLDLFCLCGDPKFCLLFDKEGHITGMQFSYPKCDVAHVDPKIYNFSNPEFIETCYYDIPAYTVRIYFRNPNKLAEEECGRSLQDKFEGLWTTLDGELVRYDSKCLPNTPFIPKGEFVMQGCTAQIGLVYLRRFDENSICQNGFFHYLFYEKGDMIGFGHAAPGKVSPGPKKIMHNNPNGPVFEEIIPNPPPCFYDMEQYGFTAFNIFIIKDPWYIRCPKCHCSSE